MSRGHEVAAPVEEVRDGGVDPDGSLRLMPVTLAAPDVRMAANIVRRYRNVCDLPVMAQPNAGAPVLENMKVVYNQSPEEMSAELAALTEAARNAGATLTFAAGTVHLDL